MHTTTISLVDRQIFKRLRVGLPEQNICKHWNKLLVLFIKWCVGFFRGAGNVDTDISGIVSLNKTINSNNVSKPVPN